MFIYIHSYVYIFINFYTYRFEYARVHSCKYLDTSALIQMFCAKICLYNEEFT